LSLKFKSLLCEGVVAHGNNLPIVN
jgi:hypothetical protein